MRLTRLRPQLTLAQRALIRPLFFAFVIVASIALLYLARIAITRLQFEQCGAITWWEEVSPSVLDFTAIANAYLRISSAVRLYPESDTRPEDREPPRLLTEEEMNQAETDLEAIRSQFTALEGLFPILQSRYDAFQQAELAPQCASSVSRNLQLGMDAFLRWAAAFNDVVLVDAEQQDLNNAMLRLSDSGQDVSEYMKAADEELRSWGGFSQLPSVRIGFQ